MNPRKMRCLVGGWLVSVAVWASGGAVASVPMQAPTTLDGLAWLAGCWQLEETTQVQEECWTPPRGGTMLGVNRTTKDDGGGGFEFLRIAVDGRDVVYFASPGGRTPTPFRLTSQDKGRAVFENPDHDFPQRLTYEVSAGESLRIRVEAGVGEEVRGFELHLRRVSSWP